MPKNTTYDEHEERIRESGQNRAIQKDGQNHLPKSMADYRTIFEAANDAILIHDFEDGRILDVNPKMLEMYGYTKEEALRLDMASLGEGISPLSHSRVQEYVRKAAKRRSHVFEWKARKKNGDHFWVEVSLKRVVLDDEKRVIAIVRDIGARKQAEMELKLQRDRCEYILEATNLGTWEWNVQTGETVFNERWADIIGYRLDEIAPVSIETWMKHAHPGDLDRSNAALESHFRGQSDFYDIECRMRHKDGRWVWVHDRGKVISWTDDGKPLWMYGTHQDITDRKQKEEALLSEEKKYKTILQTAVDGFWLTDMGGRILEINDAYCRMSGYSQKELLSMGVPELEGNMGPDEIASKVEEVLENGYQCFETRHRRKDGSIYDVEVSVQHLAVESGRLVIFLRDISERKKAELAMIERKKELEALNLISEVALRGHPLKAGLKEIAQKLSVALGFPVVAIEHYHEDRQEMEVAAITGIPEPADGDSILVPCDQTLSGVVARSGRLLVETRAMGRPEYSFQALRSLNIQTFVCAPMRVGSKIVGTLLLASPETLPVEEHLVTLARSLANFIASIVEHKRAEERRLELEAQLVHAQKMETVGRLAGGVAHDFNNMLYVILGYAEMALEQTDPSNQMHSDLQEIRKAAERSADITRQLLAFARKQAIVPKVLDLNETVESTLKMIQRLIGEDIHLVWRPGRDLWPVKIDPSQIDQILINLCVNARDAIRGGGRLVIETRAASIGEDQCKGRLCFAPGDFVMLSVSDDGCGMDKDTLQNIFEPFFTTKGMDQGTGLGLATVYGIVQQNKGSIDVSSEPDIGTTFRIYFRRHETFEKQTVKTDAATPCAAESETILLVEDEPAILDITRRMLEIIGYNVLTAGAPKRAIELAREHGGPIHLLLSDVVMPEMNGLELLKNMLSLFPDLKHLFMSGYTAKVIAITASSTKASNLSRSPSRRTSWPSRSAKR